MGREQDARRASIQQDLQTYGGLLGDKEKAQLEEELGLLGASNTATGLSNQLRLGLLGDETQRRGQDVASSTSKYNTDSDYDRFMRELGLREWTAGNEDYYRRAGI